MMRFGEALKPLNAKVRAIGGAGSVSIKKDKEVSSNNVLRDMELVAYHLGEAYDLLLKYESDVAIKALNANNIDVYTPLKGINKKFFKRGRY